MQNAGSLSQNICTIRQALKDLCLTELKSKRKTVNFNQIYKLVHGIDKVN